MEELFARTIKELGSLVKFSDEDSELFERVDRACDEILPYEFEYYAMRRFNEKAPEIYRKYGLMGMTVAKKYGGMGANPVVATVASERLGQLGLGAAALLGAHMSLGCTVVEMWGREDQRERYLTPAAKGDVVFAYALTEPEAGSDPTALKTTCEERGDHYILNGTKYLITNGSVANVVIVFANLDGRPEGISALLVERGFEGFNVAMRLEEKVGLFTSDTALIELNDCLVPRENILGKPGRGLHVAYSALIPGRLGVAAGCLGVMEDCLNAVVERCKQRVQHGKPIGKHQLVQQHIAQITMNLEMARWPTYVAAFKKLELDRNILDSRMRLEADQYSAIAKRIASQRACDTADRAVQVFGGFGYSILSPVGRHFCDTRVTRIFEGTDEVMDLKIASGVLGREFESFR